MKKRLLTAAFFVSAWGAYSQVGVGTLNPDASAQLDIVSTEKGVLLPRVGLKSVTDTETITKGNINSLLVFNIAEGNGVVPGYYYWYVDRWMRIVNEEEVIRLDKNTVNISLTVEAGNLLLKDSDGNTVTVPLSEINLPTTIVNNNDGTYTFINEAGETVIIDVPAAVVNQFENIYNDIVNEAITIGGASYNTFEEYLTHVANESVTIGGSEFVTVTGTGTAADPYAVAIKEGAANSMLITNAAGDVEWASLSTIVKANETVTTLVQNPDGTYTYYNEDQIGADGMPLAGATGTTIDPNMVKTRFNAVANQYEFLDAAGNVIATINMNAANVAYNNAASGLVATNVQAAIDELVNRKADLTSTSGDNSITVTNGTGTTLLNTQLHVTAGGINTLKLADNAVTAAKMNAEGAAAGSVPTATGVNGSVAYKQVPRFFYMPAVIFNTSVLTPTGTTVTRDLYQEYYNQFTGGASGTGNAVYPIAHGTNGYSVPYNGGLVKNPSAQADIYTYARSEMNYYITYYDTDVFENVTVNDNGEMSYTIKSNAKAASYMNIVFVIK